MKGEAHGLYGYSLQVEKKIEIGWLKDTLSTMNMPFLTSAIQDEIGGKTMIGLR